MVNKEKKSKGYINILNDDKFVEWRLLKTDELNRYWEEFIKNYPEKEEDLNTAIQMFKAVRINKRSLPAEVKERIYNNIILKGKKKKNFRNRFLIYASTAACLAILCAGAILFYIQNSETDKEKLLQANASGIITGESLPHTDIKLITADEVITLEQDAQLALADDGRSLVIENEASTVKKQLKEDIINKLIVPAGKRTTVVLADGSKVWLNSSSELEFPHKFTGNTRNITVKGEIYIEVAPMGDKPFYVHTPKFDVRVHGTKFNVTAYDDNDSQSVVLVEGKVEVNTTDIASTFLDPKEMFSLTAQGIEKSIVDVDEYISWKDGILIFNQTSVSEILKKIGRYYNVEFKQDEIPLLRKTCTGKLFLSENLDDVMESLSVLSSTTYYRENEKIYITNK